MAMSHITVAIPNVTHLLMKSMTSKFLSFVGVLVSGKGNDFVDFSNIDDAVHVYRDYIPFVRILEDLGYVVNDTPNNNVVCRIRIISPKTLQSYFSLNYNGITVTL